MEELDLQAALSSNESKGHDALVNPLCFGTEKRNGMKVSG